jgi:hypothetical protein
VKEIVEGKLFTYIYAHIRGSIVLKALCYKPEGLGFETL